MEDDADHLLHGFPWNLKENRQPANQGVPQDQIGHNTDELRHFSRERNSAGNCFRFCRTEIVIDLEIKKIFSQFHPEAESVAARFADQ